MEIKTINNDTIANVLTRAESTFSVIDEKRLALISDRMPAIDIANKAFGKSNTQVSNKLMTLTMLSPCSPYHTLKQILAQIEKKRGAVRESYYKLKKKEIDVEKLQRKLGNETDDLDMKLLNLDISQAQTEAAASVVYIEGALKEIGSYQTAYIEVCESHGLSEEIDEEQMEKAEVEHHIKSGIRLAIRDVINSGRLGMGTMEYLEQLGMNPMAVLPLVTSYIEKTKTTDPTFEDLMTFLDACAEKFKDAHKQVMARLGIKTLIDSDWLYKGNS